MTRLPDFLILGAQKAGTTTLFRWLDGHPDVTLPMKEPHFFSEDDLWRRGLNWYADLFRDIPTDQIAGEASPLYGDPAFAANTADRIWSVIPNVKLLYLVRDPVERLRSHYRHEIQRGRERRVLSVAVSEPGNAYVRRSRYSLGLAPYLDLFPREQIIVCPLEQLIDGDKAWHYLLDRLGVRHTRRPETAKNAASDKPFFTRPMLWLWEKGLTRPPKWIPGPIRTLGRKLLLRSGDAHLQRLEGSLEPLPEAVLEELAAEGPRLQSMLGLDRPFWSWPEDSKVEPTMTRRTRTDG